MCRNKDTRTSMEKDRGLLKAAALLNACGGVIWMSLTAISRFFPMVTNIVVVHVCWARKISKDTVFLVLL